MTKKFLVAFSEQGIRKTKRNEFLIPNPTEFANYFIGLETGKICQYGLVVYTGVDLTPNLICEKLLNNKIIAESNLEIESLLSEYMQFLKNSKISDVIEIKHESGKYQYYVTGLRMKRQTSKIP